MKKGELLPVKDSTNLDNAIIEAATNITKYKYLNIVDGNDVLSINHLNNKVLFHISLYQDIWMTSIVEKLHSKLLSDICRVVNNMEPKEREDFLNHLQD